MMCISFFLFLIIKNLHLKRRDALHTMLLTRLCGGVTLFVAGPI